MHLLWGMLQTKSKLVVSARHPKYFLVFVLCPQGGTDCRSSKDSSDKSIQMLSLFPEIVEQTGL